MRSRILLLLFDIYYALDNFIIDIYFNYLTLFSLSLFDFNFRKNSNSCFSYTFIMRSIILLLLFDDYFIYLTLDV